jgi:hypothetical protein
MRFDWFKLGGRTPPTTLVEARLLAHHALQWLARTARANLKAAGDDSHSSAEWDAGLAALVSRPMPTGSGEIRIGLRMTGFALIVLRRGAVLDAFQLDRKTDAEAGAWMDSKLQGVGLRPAKAVSLPYAMPDHPVGRGAAYDCSSAGRELGEIARWFAGSAELLEEFRARHRALHPGPTPLRCWPHHFDIATLVQLEEGARESAKSVRVGMSPGDENYAQPYFYISPWPRIDDARLPPLPPPGHWHTQGFLGAVTTGDEILALKNRGLELMGFVDAAFEIGCEYLGVPSR